MNSRERILNALTGRDHDRIPWIPLCSMSYFASLPEFNRRFQVGFYGDGFTTGRGTWQEQLDWRASFYSNLGMDFMAWGDGGDVRIEVSGAETRIRETAPHQYTVETAFEGGILTRSDAYRPAFFSAFPVRHLIEERNDLSMLARLARISAVECDVGFAETYLEILRGRGVNFADIPAAPIQNALCGLSREENLLLWLHDKAPEVERYEEAQHKLNLEICRKRAAGGFQVFCNRAVLGLGLVSPSLVREHYLPYLKEYEQLMRSAGKTVLYHTSGEPVGALAQDIADARIGGLYGLSYPAPRHTPEIWEIAERLPRDTVLSGGPTPDHLSRAKPEQIKNTVRRLLEKTASCKTFLLGTSDDVVPGTPPENLQAVSEAVEEFC